MSMVSLLIAPLIKGRENWEKWGLGMIPLGIFVILSVALVYKGVLSWKDPLAQLTGGEAAQNEEGACTKAIEETIEGKPIEADKKEVAAVPGPCIGEIGKPLAVQV